MASRFSFIPEALAIDMGTTSTKIATQSGGIVLNEASAVLVSASNPNEVLGIGNSAIELCGRTPSGVKLIFPFRHGVIADFRHTELLLREFMKAALVRRGSRSLISGPRVLMCIPACITEVERSALEDATRRAGAREVLFVSSVFAACVGAGLSYTEPVGSFVACVGGGTSSAAVIALSGIASNVSIRIGGTDMDNEIVAHVRSQYNLIIGSVTAQRMKHRLSSTKQKAITVRGMNLANGMPTSREVELGGVLESLAPSVKAIVNAVECALQSTPPELASDVMETGITLTGGLSGLKELENAIAQATEVEVKVSEDAEMAVIHGAMRLMSEFRTRQNLSVLEKYS